jgi:phage anti-repressor protein
VVLLFTAIFRRIGDYGVTENRYFVLVIALWILGITVYLLLSKKKSLKILPISLFIVAMISSFGSWGVFSVSKNSQIQQFEKVYSAVKENDKKATIGQYQQLRSILDYLEERKSIFELDGITGMSIKEIFKDTLTDDKSEVYGWFDTERVLDSLRITVNQDELDKNNPYGNYYNYYPNNIINNYDIKEYQYLAIVSLNSYENSKMEINKYQISYNSEKTSLLLSKNDVKLEIPLKEKLVALTAYGTELYKANQKEMTLEAENDSISIKLVFTDLGFNIKQDSININHSSIMLFLKQK